MENSTWDMIGGSVALDFANTVDGLRGGQAIERLPSYDALVQWARAAGIITAAESEECARLAAESPDEAALVHRRALELREAVYALASTAISGDPPSSSDIGVLNTELQRAPESHAVRWAGNGFEGSRFFLLSG